MKGRVTREIRYSKVFLCLPPYRIVRQERYGCYLQPPACTGRSGCAQEGGNAIDAAVATAAALSVIEPTSNGIGADSFALIWYKGKLYGLNGSGRSPRLISGEKLLEKGLKAVPSDGWDPVMVPGTPSAWAEAVKKFGNLSLSEVLEPAAKYAEEGYPLAPNIGKQWVLGYKRFMKAGGPEKFEGWFETFAPDGKMLSDGDVFRCQAMADTLRRSVPPR